MLHTQPGAQGSSALLIAGAAITVSGKTGTATANAPIAQRVRRFFIAGLTLFACAAVASVMSDLLPVYGTMPASY